MRKVLPGRLYKYQPLSAQSLVNLKTRTLWFGRPSRLNDPFDCAVPYRIKAVTKEECAALLQDRSDHRWIQLQQDRRFVDPPGEPTEALVALVERTGRTSFEQFAASCYKDRGVTCFSEAPDLPLLWAHYAAGHRGLCLEFDTSVEALRRLHPVTYSDDVPVLNVMDVLLGKPDHILTLMLTKASCWSYEREWRAIHEEADKEYGYGVEGLTAVYLGAALTDAERDLVCHTLHGTPVKLYKMQRAPDCFRLQAEPVTYTPYHLRPDVV